MFKGKLDQCKLDIPDNVTLSKGGGSNTKTHIQIKLNQLSHPGAGFEKNHGASTD